MGPKKDLVVDIGAYRYLPPEHPLSTALIEDALQLPNSVYEVVFRVCLPCLLCAGSVFRVALVNFCCNALRYPTVVCLMRTVLNSARYFKE